MTPDDSTIKSVITRDINYLKHHLLLLVAAAVLIFGAVYGVESLMAGRAAENDAKWQTILNTQIAQTQLLQQKLATDEANWAAVNAQLLATNQKLSGMIDARDKQLQDQLKKNATLTAVEAAQRLEQQTQAKPGEITVSGNTVTLDLPITQQVVSTYDKLVVLQTDLADTKTQLKNETAVTVNLQQNIDRQKEVITGLETVNKDQFKACDAQVKNLKAQARKSKTKWFFVGVAVGYLGRVLTAR